MLKIKPNLESIIIVFFSVIPLILWLLTPAVNSPVSNFQDIIASFGEIFGLVGIVLFSINLILATRLPLIEQLFNGLNNIYQNHSFLGQIAFMLLLFHPLFLIPRYSTN